MNQHREQDDRTVKGRSRLTVCHVIPSLEMGGMERVAASLSEGFSRQGDGMLLFCLDKKGELFDSAVAQVKVCGNRRRCVFKVDWKVVAALRRFALSNGVQFLHAHNLMAHMYSVLAAIGTGMRVVVTIHGQAYFGNWRTHILQKLLSIRTAKVICVSDDIRKIAMVRQCFRSRQLLVVRNGISCDLVRKRTHDEVVKARQRLGISASAFVVGSVARFAPVKNYTMLVKAFARLCRELPDARCRGQGSGQDASVPGDNVHGLNSSPVLLLVGDGPDRRNIERAITECGISGSVLLPGLQDDIKPWLDVMDLFCLSSLTEGTSLSMLEAGARGLPSVATDVGGNSEVVENGVTGLLVPGGDEMAMAIALKTMSADSELRRKMGDAARLRVAERYSMIHMIDEYVAVYNEVLSDRS